MTALNFVLAREWVSIISDTLCTAGVEKRPFIYSSKVHAIPHLQAAFTMKGDGLFALECMKRLMAMIIARDVREADADVPALYREIWEAHVREYPDGIKRATIYHFGWVEAERRVVALEYALDRDFASREVPEGAWLHPDTVKDMFIASPEDLVQLTRRQKEIDDALPEADRAGIGGDFHHLYLDRRGIGIERVYRSADFDMKYNEMIRNAAARFAELDAAKTP